MHRVPTLFIFLFTFHFAFAQWTIDTDVNTLVADSRGEDLQAIGTSDGKTFVVFGKWFHHQQITNCGYNFWMKTVSNNLDQTGC